MNLFFYPARGRGGGKTGKKDVRGMCGGNKTQPDGGGGSRGKGALALMGGGNHKSNGRGGRAPPRSLDTLLSTTQNEENIQTGKAYFSRPSPGKQERLGHRQKGPFLPLDATPHRRREGGGTVPKYPRNFHKEAVKGRGGTS